MYSNLVFFLRTRRNKEHVQWLYNLTLCLRHVCESNAMLTRWAVTLIDKLYPASNHLLQFVFLVFITQMWSEYQAHLCDLQAYRKYRFSGHT